VTIRGDTRPRLGSHIRTGGDPRASRQTQTEPGAGSIARSGTQRGTAGAIRHADDPGRIALDIHM